MTSAEKIAAFRDWCQRNGETRIDDLSREQLDELYSTMEGLSVEELRVLITIANE